MVDNFGNISRAFIAFDRKGDGFVTLDELKRVLLHFVFPMSDYLFEQLMDRYVQVPSENIGNRHTSLKELCHAILASF